MIFSRSCTKLNNTKRVVFVEKMCDIKLMLSSLELYVPLRITDEYMGIENKPETRTITYGSTKATIKHNQEFVSILSFVDLPIVLYSYKAGGGAIPTVIYAFKVSPGDDIKTSSVVDTINRCARISPLHASP